jgi:hypothetical protein
MLIPDSVSLVADMVVSSDARGNWHIRRALSAPRSQKPIGFQHCKPIGFQTQESGVL